MQEVLVLPLTNIHADPKPTPLLYPTHLPALDVQDNFSLKKYGGDIMTFEDMYGNLLTSEELDKLPIWEVEQRGIHFYDANCV